MKNWTVTDVAERFEEAVYTLKRLPPVRVQGFKSAWPPVILSTMELLQADKLPMRLGPPSAGAISRMEETIQWITFLDDATDRRIVWLRAARVPWKPICWRLGCSRTTAHYRYRIALMKIVMRLNSKQGGRFGV
jgi:hypothetical protein